jgi:hypothetical protein
LARDGGGIEWILDLGGIEDVHNGRIVGFGRGIRFTT